MIQKKIARQLSLFLAIAILLSMTWIPQNVVFAAGTTRLGVTTVGSRTDYNIPIVGAVHGIDWYDGKSGTNIMGREGNNEIDGVEYGRLGNNTTGNWIRWANVNVEGGITGFRVAYGSDTNSSRRFEVLVSKPGAGIDNAVSLGILTFQTANFTGWANAVWTDKYTVTDSKLAGTCDVYYRYASDGYNFICLEFDTKDAVTGSISGLGAAQFNSDSSAMTIVDGAVTGITGAASGSWIKYANVDIKGSIAEFNVKYTAASEASRAVDVLIAESGAAIETATPIGAVYPSAADIDGSAKCYDIRPHAGGTKDIYVRFKGGNLNFKGLDLLFNLEKTYTLDERITLVGADIKATSYTDATITQPDGFISGIPADSWFKFTNVDLKGGASGFEMLYAADTAIVGRRVDIFVANSGATLGMASYVGGASAGLSTDGLNSAAGAGRAWAALYPTSKLVGGVKDIFVRISGGTLSFGSLTLSLSNNVWKDPQGYTETKDRPATADVVPYLRTKHITPEAYITVDNDVTPLGNGHMGAMLGGGIFNDTIVFNEHTLWSGGPGAVANYNGGHNTRTAAENHAVLASVRERIDTIWHAYESNPSTNVSIPSSVSNDVSTLFGASKGNGFGNYQELGKLVLLDPNPEPEPEGILKTPTTNDNGNASEAVTNIFASGTSGKWYASTGNPTATRPTWVTWGYDEKVTIDGYRIRTGNDTTGRDPQTWKLYGSNDEGKTWTEIHSVENGNLPSGRNTDILFEIGSAHTYQYFKLEVTRTKSNNNVQMTRFILRNGTTEITGYGSDSATTDGPPRFNYNRSLNLETGVANVSYEIVNANEELVKYNKEYYMNYPDNVFAMKISADKPFTQTLSLTTLHSNRKISVEYGNILQLVGQPSNHREDGLHFFQQAKVIPFGANASISDNGTSITVENANEIIVIMTAGTNYVQCYDDSFNYFSNKDEAFQKVKDRLENALAVGYNALLENHLKDYQNLFGRVDFRLDGVEIPEKPTTDMVGNIIGAHKGYPNNTENEKRYIELLYYQFCRYLLIASSREGSLPANLQGVWANGLNPPWNADYHTNINVQMNYWPAQSTNLAETHVPMVEYVRAQVPRGRVTANHYHYALDGQNNKLDRDVRGWICYHENNIWGNTAPGNSGASYCPAGGTWMTQDVWEYYQFTKDIEYLKDYFYVILESAIFWVDNLWLDTETNKLVSNPSYSPEHGPYTPGAQNDQAAIWEVFEMTKKAAEALTANGYGDFIAPYASQIAEIAAAQPKLAGPKIGTQGQFMEWQKETLQDVTGDGQHRHTNHLFWLHPGTYIVPGRSEQEDAFADAMKVTLNTRTDASTGWSMGWKINFWARLRDGDRTHSVTQTLLTNGTLSSLFDTHSPMQIDGNFGGLSGMTEMLLQSQGGYVELLPSLPSAWSNGHIHGLKARGNVRVDMDWSDMQLTTATLASEYEKAQDVTVKYPALTTAMLKTAAGEIVPFTKDGLDLITFTAQPGVEYVLSAIGAFPAKDAFTLQAAGSADRIIGNVTIDNGNLVNAQNNDAAIFKMDFGTVPNAGYAEIELAMGNDGIPGEIEIWSGVPNTEYAIKLAVIPEAITGSWNTFKSVKVPMLADIRGIKEVYVYYPESEAGLRSASIKSIVFHLKDVSSVVLKGRGNSSNGTLSTYPNDKIGGNNNSWIKFDDVNLLKGIKKISLNYSLSNSDNNREVRVFAADKGVAIGDATLIGTFNLTNTTNTSVFKDLQIDPIVNASGVKDIYLQFIQSGIRYGGLTFDLESYGVDVLTSIVKLVEGCAANIPFFTNGDTVRVFNADGDMIGEAPVVDGKAMLSFTAAEIGSGQLTYCALLNGEVRANGETAIPIVAQTDLWAPTLSESAIDFAAKVSFVPNKGSLTVNGSNRTFEISENDMSIEIGGAALNAGDIVIVKGVKYYELFPSYSFTFANLIKK